MTNLLSQKSRCLFLCPITALITLSCIFLPGCRTASNNALVKNPNGRNDTWSYTGPGGGGAMFNPAVSPGDPDYAFVACDMTGSFVTYNGGKSWRMFCLHGPVSFFVFDPVNPYTVYANSIALFKSTDRGNTWMIIYPETGNLKGIVAKGDHAEEIVITNDSTTQKVLALAVDPYNSDRLHATISVNGKVNYFYSEDQGQHWIKDKEFKEEIKHIFIDPSSPEKNRTLFFTGKNSITARDNGNWITYAGPENVKQLSDFAGGYDKSINKFIIYAISGRSYFTPEGDVSGIYYTDDGAKTWINRQNDLIKIQVKGASLPEWRCIATSPLHPEIIYVSYNGLKLYSDTIFNGVARSRDYGRTWDLVWKDRISKGTESSTVNYGKGWIDERFGPTWGDNPFSMAVAASNPEICYTTDFGRTIKTSDGGLNWQQVYTTRKEGHGWASRGLEVTTGYNIVFDPFNINHVFIADTDIGLLESNDGGESWVSATYNNGIPPEWVNTTYWLTFDPEAEGKAWAVMSYVHDLPRPKMWRRGGVSNYDGGILATEDAGKSWHIISKDIGKASFTHILIDPLSNKNTRTIYACAFGKGVYKSTNGGKTWELKNKGIDGSEPFAWRIVNDDKSGHLYLIISRRSEDGSIGNEQDGAVYKSADKAETWSKMSLPEGVNGPTCLISDPDNGDRLLLAAWGRKTNGKFTPDTGGGIFLSKDGGNSWKQVLVKDQHINDITFDKRNNTFYACGFEGSAYRSVDHGENWIRIRGYNFKWGKRVEPDPIDPQKIFIITFGGGVWHGYASGDETATEDVISPFAGK